MDDLERHRRQRHKDTIMNSWDEITERLNRGETVSLETFVPDTERREKKNAAIEKMLANKQKL
jgi:hypothetical protein